MQSSLLGRGILSSSTASRLNETQLQMDATLTGLSNELNNPLSLAAMITGGVVFKGTNLLLGRMTSPLLAESGLLTRTLTQGLIKGTSLFTEVAAFRTISHRSFNVYQRNEFLNDMITFGTLKGVGRAAQGQSTPITHLFQAGGMVAAHNIGYGLGLTTRPEGTLLQQLVEAEATNVKLGLAMSVVHTFTPGISQLERSMDLEQEALDRSSQSEYFSSIRKETSIPEMASETTDLGALGTPEGEALLPVVAVNRDHLPETKYFIKNGPKLSLATRAGYARSHRRHATIGDNSHHTLWTPFRRRDDYAPFGGGNVERMNANFALPDILTPKFNWAAVFSPSTAVLGFGAAAIAKDYVLRAIHGQPIMVGKKHHFEQDGIVNTAALCGTVYFSYEDVLYLNGLTPPEAEREAQRMRAIKFIEATIVFAENFGFRNYEDVQGADQPIMGDVLRATNAQTKSAYWFDDTDGTGIITMMGVLNWLYYYSNRVPGRTIETMRGMFSGAGAGTKGVYEQMIMHGARHENLLATDTKGVLFEGKESIATDRIKKPLSQGIPEGTSFDEFAKGADFWINLGSPNTFTENLEWTEKILRNMGPHPLIGLLTNPETGLTAEWILSIRPDAQIISGNQEFMRNVGYVIANNFGAFTYTGRGSLWAGATEVTPNMIRAAALGGAELARLGPPPHLRDRLPRHMREFGPGYLIPPPYDERLLQYEALPVSLAALEDGVSVFLNNDSTPQAREAFRRGLDDKVRWTTALVLDERARLDRDGPRYFSIRFQDRYAPFALREGDAPEYDVVPDINAAEYQFYAQRMGVRQGDRENLLDPQGEVRVQAITELLTQLRDGTVEDTAQAQLAFKELTAILHITHICPALGLALARRRTLMLPEDLDRYPTVFQDENVMGMIRHAIPEIVDELSNTFPIVPSTTP